ncbi:MAG: DUF1788 domain-containing protein [Clostridia bacterium]|nr:DUF1788 domain-containing protein [Clostridia bacterium]
MRTIENRLQEVYDKLKTKKLSETQSLGNGLKFFIFDYDPEDEEKVYNYFETYLNVKDDFHLRIVDVYDCIINILKEKGYLEKVYKMEKEKGIDYTNGVITSTIGVGSSRDLLLNEITKDLKKDEILVLKGIGKCFGVVRAHTILSNLEKVVDENPVLLLYPGGYDENGLRLFNKLKPNDYYKAIQLVYKK